MAFDFDNIAGLKRGASFSATHLSSAIDFLQTDYVWNSTTDTIDCPDPLPPFTVHHLDAAWDPPGVTPRSLSLRDDVPWDTSLLVPADDPIQEGLTDETLAEYVARVGAPAWIAVTGVGNLDYLAYFSDCSTPVDPGQPGFGLELDGPGVGFGSGERGYLALGVNAEGVHGQGALSVAVAKATASYTADPTNDATLALFDYSEVDEGVFYFEDDYVAHSLFSQFGTGFEVGIRTYFYRHSRPGAEWQCVL